MTVTSIWQPKSSAALAALTFAIAALALHAGPSLAAPADATSAPSSDMQEVVVTGTRQSGVAAADSPAPIQIVSSESLRSTGAPDLRTALAQLVPSLQMEAFGFDEGGQTLLARLRLESKSCLGAGQR